MSAPPPARRISSTSTKGPVADSRTRPQTNRRSSSLIKDPDVVAHPDLVDLRYNQWRRFTRDPFMPPLDGESESKKPKVENQAEPDSDYPRRVRYPGSGWTHLFYDLAWTATFATLSQNGKFDEPLDLLSYFAFFAAVLWLWASQTLYSIHFYTNDWFHLTSIFLQLFIFGMLAATTNGYDVTTYISRTPGGDSLNSPESQEPLSGEEELEEFAANRVAELSARAMAVAFAATRFIHLLQYVRACIYARWGKGAPKRGYTGWGRYVFDYVHPQIFAILIGLIFSNFIFFAVVGIVFTEFGITRLGASLKLGLWIGGFLLEIGSHLWYPIMRRINYFQVKVVGHETIQEDNTPLNDDGESKTESKTTPHDKNTIGDETSGNPEAETGPNSKVGANPLPLAGVKLSERLDTITTIILGEGINGFAGTLTSILTAPGVWRVVGTNVVSAAFIIWFIVYIYFEGPTASNPSGEGLRRLVWMVTYLPFLSSIFLLFIGIKNQFILTSTISTVDKTFTDFTGLLIQQGLSKDTVTNPEFRSNPILKDFLFARGMVWSDELDKLILTELLHGSLEGARYILIFAAGILICLGVQSIVHSRIRDRYQWGVIISRLLMGLILALLLLLNLGTYQAYYIPVSLKSQRARVYNWLDANWILPTIALAYGVEFLVELILAFFAKRATAEAKTRTRAKAAFTAVAVAVAAGRTEIPEHIAPASPKPPRVISPPPFLDEKERRVSEITAI
ncbi:unnamed protein product [Rhizoctonia solani]|uniref:Uncharacterized protein n=1 Tax=Rhizoctonia solani TaxID=456999 RepID=A0A8H3HQ29_9AGAM|nr:unnamed protein product [Rhizoctonia solani]